uniref:Uncharacterized protein n=1 Tax=Daphnia magna TaxID=35525 RepID=A0A0P6I1H4_9CRUS
MLSVCGCKVGFKVFYLFVLKASFFFSSRRVTVSKITLILLFGL